MISDKSVIQARSLRALRVMTSWILAVLVAVCSVNAFAQTPAHPPASADQGTPPTPAQAAAKEPEPPTLISLPRNLFIDQKDFWTTPFHLNKRQWKWTVPLAFVGAG